MRQSGHPHGWPGHVVDHIVPVAKKPQHFAAALIAPPGLEPGLS